MNALVGFMVNYSVPGADHRLFKQYKQLSATLESVAITSKVYMRI